MKRGEIHIRDPFVLVHGGKYYLYGTRGETAWGKATGFDVYVSVDLENWSEAIECFRDDGSFWAKENYWAPEVYAYRGAFYMFASFLGEGMCRGTAILRAESPLGPFVPHSDECVTPADWECLDGTLHVDRVGQPWMVFCHEWVQVTDGEVAAMPLTEDLRASSGAPRVLWRASEAPWVVRKSNRTSSGFVTDGPFLHRTEEGELLCLWASFSEAGYTQGIARSDNGEITGRFVQLPPLKLPNAGHGMLFRTREGELTLTLHSPNEFPLERPFFYPMEEADGSIRLKER